MEKKFADRHVVFVAQRRIVPKPPRNASKSQKFRPFSRTLTSVHEKILEDLVYPTEIVGKRTRYGIDGTSLIKVYVAPLDRREGPRADHCSPTGRFLDSKDATSLEYKLDSFSSVYKRLTGKDVVFEFPVTAAE